MKTRRLQCLGKGVLTRRDTSWLAPRERHPEVPGRLALCELAERGEKTRGVVKRFFKKRSKRKCC